MLPSTRRLLFLEEGNKIMGENLEKELKQIILGSFLCQTAAPLHAPQTEAEICPLAPQTKNVSCRINLENDLIKNISQAYKRDFFEALYIGKREYEP